MKGGEILQFFGVMILITRFKFGMCGSLWSPNPLTKYVPAPAIGEMTLMSKNRFKDLFHCLHFSDQPAVQPLECPVRSIAGSW